MWLKSLLVIVAIAFSAFFLYILIEIERCCEDLRANQEEVLPEEVRAEEEVLLETRMLHFGDLMLDRGVGRTLERGVDPFENIKTFIKNGSFDVVVANLEGPFTHSLDCQIKPYSFRFEPETVTLLSRAGITAVTLANNHSNDCYEYGIKESRDILQTAGIVPFGDDTWSLPRGDEWYAEKLGVTFFGFDTTLGLQVVEEMKLRVGRDTEEDSRSVAHIHWGNEYKPYPSVAQQNLATTLASEGVSLIIGHHPHVIEPAEIIDETVVFYSLGNFIFDQDTIETQIGYAVEERTFFEGDGTMLSRDFIVHPYRIIGHMPTLLQGEERSEVCNRVLHSIGARNENACSFSVR